MNKQKKVTRIVCLILAFLMVAGVATVGISLIADALSGGHDTEQSESHEGHNHD